jgi:hypothetical protein
MVDSLSGAYYVRELRVLYFRYWNIYDLNSKDLSNVCRVFVSMKSTISYKLVELVTYNWKIITVTGKLLSNLYVH